MPGNKAKLKASKSHVFVLILALLIIYAAFVSGSGGYCSAREFFQAGTTKRMMLASPS